MKIGHRKNFRGGVIFPAIGLMFAVLARGGKPGYAALLA